MRIQSFRIWWYTFFVKIFRNLSEICLNQPNKEIAYSLLDPSFFKLPPHYKYMHMQTSERRSKYEILYLKSVLNVTFHSLTNMCNRVS